MVSSATAALCQYWSFGLPAAKARKESFLPPFDVRILQLQTPVPFKSGPNLPLAKRSLAAVPLHTGRYSGFGYDLSIRIGASAGNAGNSQLKYFCRNPLALARDIAPIKNGSICL